MKNFDVAIDLAGKIGHIFVTTADQSGMPHVAAAGQIDKASNDSVSVSAWFCPGTVANLEDNHRISLVVWDPTPDRGFQLLGTVERVIEQSVMNGYVPESERQAPMPQIERKLLIRVNKVLSFSHAPHSDLE